MKIIVVYNDETQILDFLAPVRPSYSFNFVSYSDFQLDSFSVEDKDLLLIPSDLNCLRQIASLSLENTVYVFGDYNKSAKEIKAELHELKKSELISGFIDLGIPVELQIDFLEFAALDVMSMNKKLTGVINFFQKDLLKLKKMHEKLVPLREVQHKGITISSKFAAGQAAGGEFFDVCKYEKNILVLLVKTSSYQASSKVLSEFEILKQKNELDLNSEISFVNKVEKIKEQEKDNGLELIMLDISLASLEVEVFGINSNSLILIDGKESESNNLSQKPTTLKLSRQESLDLISSGYMENTEDTKSLTFNYQKSRALPTREYLNEMLFNIKKDHQGPFIDHDASLVRIEVGKNVIVKA